MLDFFFLRCYCMFADNNHTYAVAVGLTSKHSKCFTTPSRTLILAQMFGVVK